MKRHGQVMPAIATYDNVAAAFHRAGTGKRDTRAARDFAADFDCSVNRIVSELSSGAWQPAGYERFTVRDPKLRVIHAAPFRDRVAHHALMRVAGPLLEKSALPHSHACRTGKGNLAAVRHASRCTRRLAYFLKLDVRRYFDSIPHTTLLHLLRRKFKDGAFIEVMTRIVHSFEHQAGCGLPIGTLTSQFLANFFLDGLDRWIVETLRAPGYVRYMDDFILWHDDSGVLAGWQDEIVCWLASERGLEIKGAPRALPCRSGVPFLGYRITPRGVLLGQRARRRFIARLGAEEAAHARGEISAIDVQRRTDALLAFTDVARCRAWRRAVLHGDVSPEPQAPTASCAAAPGTTRRRTAAPPSATGTTLATAGTTRACACPQLTRITAAAARLTRSLELRAHCAQEQTPHGAGREAGRPQPNAP